MTSAHPTDPATTTAVLSAAELASVARLMAEAGVVPAGPLVARLVAGGRSNLTIRLDDGRSTWVLRTPPRVGRTPSAHDVGREYRVTQALRDSPVPVPRAVLHHEGHDLLGGPFTIAEFVQGRTVQARGDLEELPAAQVEAIVEALCVTLAALHDVDHRAVGLERFGRPGGYAQRQLARWAGQWQIVGAPFSNDVRARAAALETSLSVRLPRQASTGVVHGDYRIDNTLLRLTGTSAAVAAVVDWELSTIGDPVADVALMCVYRHPAFDLVIGEPCAWTSDLLPDHAGLASAYEKAGGAELVDFEEHLALGYFKLAVIAAGIDHRSRAAATGVDTAGSAVEPLLDAGLDVLRGRSPAPT